MSLYHQRWHLAGKGVVCSLSPQENMNPCRGPFTAENCSGRGAEAQNSPQQMCHSIFCSVKPEPCFWAQYKGSGVLGIPSFFIWVLDTQGCCEDSLRYTRITCMLPVGYTAEEVQTLPKDRPRPLNAEPFPGQALCTLSRGSSAQAFYKQPPSHASKRGRCFLAGPRLALLLSGGRRSVKLAW